MHECEALKQKNVITECEEEIDYDSFNCCHIINTDKVNF